MSLVHIAEAPSIPASFLLDPSRDSEADWFFRKYEDPRWQEPTPKQVKTTRTLRAWARRGIARLCSTSKERRDPSILPASSVNTISQTVAPGVEAKPRSEERKYQRASGAIAVFGGFLVSGGLLGGEGVQSALDYFNAAPEHVIVVSQSEAGIIPVAHQTEQGPTSLPTQFWYPPIDVEAGSGTTAAHTGVTPGIR